MAIESQSSNLENIADTDLSKEDIVDLLNEDDDTPPEEKEEKVVKEGEEQEEEDPEKKKDEIKIKDEDEEEDEEEPQGKLTLTPAKRQEILKKYPNFFKEFPEVEKSYFRDRAFTEVFATPEEAKDASERAETLGVFEKQLNGGDITSVLKEIKDKNPAAFTKLADNYLAALQKVDGDAQIHVVSGIVKGLIVSLWTEAQTQDNEELKKVALAINQFAFGKSSFEPHKPLSGPEEPKEIQNERQKFMEERYTITVNDLDRKVGNALKSAINSYIDPKNQMTDWAKDNAVKEALEATFTSLRSDNTFRGQLDKLWKRAAENKFDSSSVNAVKKAYLNKAQTVIGNHIKKARNNALKGLGKRVREEQVEEPETKAVKKTRDSSSSTTRGQKQPDRKVSTLDYLNQD